MRQENRKNREICSSAILVRGNKFVLLYDRKKKHYVLPQGHKRKRETLSDTAMREAREETGFQELLVTRRLGRYQYHFDQGRKIIYKSIHIYLLKTISSKRFQNTQNVNENFTTHLFSFKDAVEMVKWKQDRKFISLARQFLKI